MASATVDGGPFEFTATKRSFWVTGSQTLATISVPWNGNGSLKIVRKNHFDRFAIDVGMARPHVTGDPDFDDRLYIATENLQDAATLGKTAEERALIVGLFDNDITIVYACNGKLYATTRGRRINTDRETGLPSDEADRQWAEAVACNLHALAKLEPVGPACKPSNWFAGVLFTLPVVALVLWATNLRTDNYVWDRSDAARLHHIGLIWSGAAVMSIVALTLAIMWGRATTHKKVFAEFCILSLTGLLTGFSIPSILNAELDGSKPVQQLAGVIDKSVTRHQKSPDVYYAKVATDAGEMRDLRISSADYDRLQPGQDCLLLSFGPGWLGARHVSSYVVQPCRGDTGDLSRLSPL